LTQEKWTAEVLSRIAEALLETYDLEEALTVAQKIDDESRKAAALAKIGFEVTGGYAIKRSFDSVEKLIARSIAETLLFDLRGSEGLSDQ
jgi:type II secretory pathway component PulF